MFVKCGVFSDFDHCDVRKKSAEQIQRQSCVAQLGLIMPSFSVQYTVSDVIWEGESKQGVFLMYSSKKY